MSRQPEHPELAALRALIAAERGSWIVDVERALAAVSKWAHESQSAIGEVSPHDLSFGVVTLLAEQLGVDIAELAR